MIVLLDLISDEEDKDKFVTLYQTYYPLLYTIAMDKLNNPQDAEDCVQDTFFYVAKNFDKIDEVKSVKTKCYLSTIVSGYAIKKFNRFKNISFKPLDDIDECKDDRLQHWDNYDTVEIASVINKLNEVPRLYLYLTYYFGYSSIEIAEMYGTTETAVRQTLSRARKQIKKLLLERE